MLHNGDREDYIWHSDDNLGHFLVVPWPILIG